MTCILSWSHTTYIQTMDDIIDSTWTHLNTQYQCQWSMFTIWYNIHWVKYFMNVKYLCLDFLNSDDYLPLPNLSK